jgi:hypothetical protein
VLGLSSEEASVLRERVAHGGASGRERGQAIRCALPRGADKEGEVASVTRRRPEEMKMTLSFGFSRRRLGQITPDAL